MVDNGERPSVLRTRLSANECAARISGRIIGASPNTWFRGVEGRVIAEGFQINKKRPFDHGLWQTRIEGRFVPTANGTEIRLSYRGNWWMNPIVGLGFAALLGVPQMLVPSPMRVFFTIFPFVLIGGLQLYGRWAYRDDDVFLIAFLEEVLHARDVGNEGGNLDE